MPRTAFYSDVSRDTKADSWRVQYPTTSLIEQKPIQKLARVLGAHADLAQDGGDRNDRERKSVVSCGADVRTFWLAEPSLTANAGAPANADVGADRVRRQQRGRLLTLAASRRWIAASCISELALPVESRCGAVAVGSVCLLPPLSFGGALITSP
jgi:hypothetical protein